MSMTLKNDRSRTPTPTSHLDLANERASIGGKLSSRPGLILTTNLHTHHAAQDVEDPESPSNIVMEPLHHQPYDASTEGAFATLARQRSLRQSMALGTFVMVLYLVVWCCYFNYYIGWSIRDTLFFMVYTITTVGYGTPHYGAETDDKSIPPDRNTLLFITFGTLLGIAFWFLFLQLATTFVIETRFRVTSQNDDKVYIAKRGLEALESYSNYVQDTEEHSDNITSPYGDSTIFTKLDLQKYFRSYTGEKTDSIFYKIKISMQRKCIDKVKDYIHRTNLKPAIKFLAAVCGSIGFFTITIMILENWTYIKSLYFSVITLTTIGYGDVYPETNAGIWFVTIYLPVSNVFVSFYLINVTKFYIIMYGKHVERVEDRLKAKHHLEDHRTNTNKIEESNEEEDYSDLDDEYEIRRSLSDPSIPDAFKKMTFGQKSQKRQSLIHLIDTFNVSELEGISVDENRDSGKILSEPPQRIQLSKLRINLKSQTRLNHIIAKYIVHTISLSDNCEVFLDKDAFGRYCNQWLIPNVARDVFLVAAVRIVFMAGKQNLLSSGEKVINELDSVELNRVYSPVLLVMGVSDLFLFTWLNRTAELLPFDSTSNTYIKTDSDETKSEHGC